MREQSPLSAANIKRLADADQHKQDLWEAVKWIIVERRSQMPSKGTGTPAKPFPSIPAIVSGLNHYEYKTTHGKKINYNTVSRLLEVYYDEWIKIPSARQMEDELPSPRIHRFGRVRLLQDVSEFCEGDCGMVVEIVDGGVIASFYDGQNPKTGLAQHMRVFVQPHQMRMLPSNLHDWHADQSEIDHNRIADMLDGSCSES